MLFSEGTRLGPYEITAPFGAGGMGEVYKAHDTRLDRTVAIKVLPSTLVRDAHARQRFAREARAIAALSHPHICPLFDIGHQEGADYLVMEFLEGESLADRLVRSRLPLDQAMRYAIEISEALAAAHAAGIVHRDLKPGNIMLTRTGAKLLDFGLAKPRLEPPSGTSDVDTQQPITGEGGLTGTLQYMSPEQVEGREADTRSDIFALGAVIYEMLTSRRPFDGRSQASLIAAILYAEPPAPSTAVPALSPGVDYFVRACLSKNPDDRWQSAHDVLLELRWLEQERVLLAPPLTAAAGAVRFKRAGWFAALAVALAAVAVIAGLMRSSPAEPVRHRARFDVALPDALGFDFPDWPVVSPSGQHLVFTARLQGKRQLWMRSLDGSVQPLADTEGATFPFWSPDSRRVAFFSGGKLKRVDVAGGPVTILSDAYSVSRGAWGPDGTILFSPRQNGAIHAVAEGGGASRAMTTLNAARGETGHQFPRFLPDGRRFLFAAAGPDPGVYVASLDGGPGKQISRTFTATLYVPPGYLLFSRQRSLMAQPFDAKTLELQGTPVAIADPVSGGAFSASDDGTLVFRPGGGSQNDLVWIGRNGNRIATVGPPAHYQQVVLSPGGHRAAVQRMDTDTGNADVWVVDLDTAIASRLTLDPAMDGDPAWSPDERSLAFTSYRSGKGSAWLWDFVSGRESPLFELPGSAPDPAADRPGTAAPTSLAPARIPEGIAVDDWTRDGKHLVVRTFGRAVYSVPLTGDDRTARMLADTPFVEDQSQVSPDGRWIAFNSDESGRWETYVARFPEFTDKRQVSSAGGMQPRWRRDGKELFYLSLDGVIMSAEIGGATVRGANSVGAEPSMIGAPSPLFQTHLSPSPNVPQYDVTADGTRFLVLEPARSGGEPITFVLNWAAGFRR
jgi:eukaryotic-like serine/threonine-protein kinase